MKKSDQSRIEIALERDAWYDFLECHEAPICLFWTNLHNTQIVSRHLLRNVVFITHTQYTRMMESKEPRFWRTEYMNWWKSLRDRWYHFQDAASMMVCRGYYNNMVGLRPMKKWVESLLLSLGIRSDDLSFIHRQIDFLVMFQKYSTQIFTGVIVLSDIIQK